MNHSRPPIALTLLIAFAIVPLCFSSNFSTADQADSAADFRNYERYALRHKGDAAQGKKLFADQRTKCAVCHQVEGQGGDVGKDLSAIGGKFDRPHLIESLLEPSRQIVEGYRTTNILTVNGRVVSGIVKSQTEKQVTLADANGKLQVIERASIDDLSISSVSLMPEGLAKELSLSEFTDLIAYLESLRAGVKQKMGAGLAGPISIPDGFELETVATGLDGATALEVLPDGRILVCEQPGRVRVIEQGKLLVEPFVTLPVDSLWERGVIGVTHDPAFPEEPYIYVCWVTKDPYPHHRVSRFTMDGNVAVGGSEKLLLTGDDQSKMGGKVPAGHQGGALHFGKDGKLYIGIGEQTSGLPSQRLDTFLGKILRINSDGSIPQDNPFVDQAKGKYLAIWARGARNPFTFAFRDSDGLMLINDVGGEFEEVNVGRAGANYGWPVVEHGDLPQYNSDDYDGPIHWYKQSSLNGGDFCPTGGRWPKQWQGRYFFADFVQGWIHTINPAHPNRSNTFLEGIRRPVDLRFAPDGSLYVLLRNAWVIDDKFEGGTGALLRIRPSHLSLKSPAGKVSAGKVVLTADTIDESAGNLPAFKIETESATYFLEKSGGGLSSLVDRDGNDWLGFHPASGSGAGGEYRGFPNAVHKQGGSYFHAMNEHTDAMNTRVERVADDYVSIIAESKGGEWQGRYEFFATHCTFTVTKMPAEKKYWVLYEGTPGGTFEMSDWWMTSAIDTPQSMGKRHDGDIPSPEWIAFGDQGVSRALALLNHEDDEHSDSFYEMQGKMTVFGFGRHRLDAFHSRVGQRFTIGFVESDSHKAISEFVDQIVGANESPLSTSQQLGPRSGDVYREYALHNGGEFNWRVTDPRSKKEGAQMFLPNPVLKLSVRDLKAAVRAEVVLDRWGGHAGTKDKKIRFNENEWITLPELTTTPGGHAPERYHSQDNPLFAVPLDHLIHGDNKIESTVGSKNQTAWGQWGLYSLILRIYYDPEKKACADGRIVSPASGDTLSENPTIELASDANAERIDVLAWYDGYDEDGDGIFQGWHGSRFQPSRGQAAELSDHVGTIDPSRMQRSLIWDTHWVPDQQPRSIKLIARIHDESGLVRVTHVVDGLSLKRDGWSVKQYRATDVPEKFSVRVGQSKSCGIVIADDAPLDRAEEAVLHYRTWEADESHEPFQINGHAHANQGKNHHYDYDLLPIPIAQLKAGENTFTIRSNTEHHMLEVLWPGPAITVRYRVD